MTKPTISPFTALEFIRANGGQEIHRDGFKYYLDAPMMCDDPSAFFPVASKEDMEWFPSGDETDDITEGTYWICVTDASMS